MANYLYSLFSAFVLISISSCSSFSGRSPSNVKTLLHSKNKDVVSAFHKVKSHPKGKVLLESIVSLRDELWVEVVIRQSTQWDDRSNVHHSKKYSSYSICKNCPPSKISQINHSGNFIILNLNPLEELGHSTMSFGSRAKDLQLYFDLSELLFHELIHVEQSLLLIKNSLPQRDVWNELARQKQVKLEDPLWSNTLEWHAIYRTNTEFRPNTPDARKRWRHSLTTEQENYRAEAQKNLNLCDQIKRGKLLEKPIYLRDHWYKQRLKNRKAELGKSKKELMLSKILDKRIQSVFKEVPCLEEL